MKQIEFNGIRFLGIHLAILLLLASWLLSPAIEIWDSIDHFTFKSLNSILRDSSFWQGFWAICNHRIMDWIHDLIMLAFYLYYIFQAAKHERLRRFSQLLLCILFFFLTILFINKTLITDYVHPRRASPTMVYKDAAVSLSNEIQWIHVKDHSKTCYPGDHGTTACLFAFSIFYFMGWRYGLYATIYTIFFILPRLVVGAHWLTDIFLGSLPIALLSSCWVLCTPFESLFTNTLTSTIRFFTTSINSHRSRDEPS